MNTSTMFWKKVRKSDGCWEWSGSLNKDGYGIVCLPRIRGRVVTKLAHRVSFETYVAPIPDGLFVCHHCDNPPCVRPGHLFVGTNADNMRDKKEKNHNRIAAECVW